MSYNKYERRRQHFSDGKQRVTYKNKNCLIFTLRITQSNQWVGVCHAARIHSLNSPPVTSSVD